MDDENSSGSEKEPSGPWWKGPLRSAAGFASGYVLTPTAAITSWIALQAALAGVPPMTAVILVIVMICSVAAVYVHYADAWKKKRLEEKVLALEKKIVGSRPAPLWNRETVHFHLSGEPGTSPTLEIGETDSVLNFSPVATNASGEPIQIGWVQVEGVKVDGRDIPFPAKTEPDRRFPRKVRVELGERKTLEPIALRLPEAMSRTLLNMLAEPRKSAFGEPEPGGSLRDRAVAVVVGLKVELYPPGATQPIDARPSPRAEVRLTDVRKIQSKTTA